MTACIFYMFDCFSALLSLQHLSVNVPALQMCTGQLGALTNLTFLDIQCQRHCQMPSCDNIETRINIDIDFGKLVLLRVFSLHSSVFGFRDQTCDLLRCRYLESVCFFHCSTCKWSGCSQVCNTCAWLGSKACNQV